MGYNKVDNFSLISDNKELENHSNVHYALIPS